MSLAALTWASCIWTTKKTLPAILAVASLVAFANLKLHAQTPPPAPKNLVANGGFENSARRENLWYGVDSAGYLAGERAQVSVLTLRGEIADTPMPISVGVADMNGDGLPDILTDGCPRLPSILFQQRKQGAKVHYWQRLRDFSYAGGTKRSRDQARVPECTASAKVMHGRHDEIGQKGFDSWELPWRGISYSQ